MKFSPLSLEGAFQIDLELSKDDRGFFARSFCSKEFNEYNINIDIKQCNLSYNKEKGTLRGRHYQSFPHEEAKLVSCNKGSIYDVIIDIKPDSSTYLKWAAFELSRNNRRMLYIPEGFAHGFQTLEDEVDVFYHMFEYYTPNVAKGIRWNDPLFNIKWPLPISEISEKDISYEDYII